MKYLILILLSALSALACPQPKHPDQPSVHGMLIVGKEKIYLSHLPMFHSPHDYQVILEVQLAAAGRAAYLESLETSAETVYTLVPEVFVLPEMVEKPRLFKAQLYAGHFERGGVKIAGNVDVVISKVIYFKKFSTTALKPNVTEYILFGNDTEQFLAHTIVAKPDFDQVLQISAEPKFNHTLTQKNYVSLRLDGLKNQPLLPPVVVRTEQSALLVEKEFYLEYGDLQN